jgi:hypothetical protein
MCFQRQKDCRTAVQAAHGSGDADLAPTGKAMQLPRRVLLKMIESRNMPIRKHLAANLFGGRDGTV